MDNMPLEMSNSSSDIPSEILALLGMTEDTRRNREFFAELLRFADRVGMTDSQIYNAIGLSRSLWYRMRDHKDARTKKTNVLKLAIVLRLSFWEAFYLVALAGYAFMPGLDDTDKTVAACLLNGVYDPDTIDGMLASNNLETLFSEK